MLSPWQTYTKGQRQPVIEQMLTTYAHLVDYQVQRVMVDLPASVDRDDLASEARIGLIDAINRFDPSVNVKFETYASIRIKGAIVDYLRKLDWAPRSLRQRAREISHAESELEQQLGEKPNEEQVARKLEMSIDQFRKTLSDISVLSILSFRDLEENETEFQIKSTGSEPEDAASREDFSRCLALAIEKLSEREQVVLDLYYRKSMSLKEIGQIMELSESRICQIHSAAVMRLRATLKDWQGEF